MCYIYKFMGVQIREELIFDYQVRVGGQNSFIRIEVLYYLGFVVYLGNLNK